MERSFAYGYTVTPDTVAKNSSYTPDGSIYWPSSYDFITGSDYISRIFSLLRQGKTVIVGATNRYGGQHWVVVTGYTPKGSISADDKFSCTGSFVAGGARMKCWRYYRPHGTQTLTEALGNSCNPVFIQLGLEMGKEIFYK